MAHQRAELAARHAHRLVSETRASAGARRSLDVDDAGRGGDQNGIRKQDSLKGMIVLVPSADSSARPEDVKEANVKRTVLAFLVSVGVCVAPIDAHAQSATTGAIAGTVRDT